MNPSAKRSEATTDARKKVTPPNFDTLRAVRNLKKAEFGDKQAVTLVETLQDAQSELATKADLAEMEFRLRGEMEARFNKLSWHILAVAGGATGTITGILTLVILFAPAK